jgi:hypothetical protein
LKAEVSSLEKNVYSLVLLDDVVDAVDRLACERSVSRSSLVNQILAKYLSCPIPETRIHDIFSCMESMLAGFDNFKIREQPSSSMVTIRSSIHYRYRPTVRYTLELYRKYEPYIGGLRAAFRTQNSSLLQVSEDFFRFWQKLENQLIGPYFAGRKVPSSAEPGRYTRRLRCPKNENDRTCEKAAHAILCYLHEFDSALKEYLGASESEGSLKKAEHKIEEGYLEYLRNAIIL